MAHRDISQITFPPELLDMLDTGKNLKGSSLEELAQLLQKKRDEAIAHRVNLGIDQLFMNCEDAYIGIDDMNRTEYMSGQWVKPTTLNAPVSTTDKTAKATAPKRSTVFVRLTSRYVDAGTAKVCEILVSPNDKAFSFEPEPVPELIRQQEDRSPATDPSGKPLFRPATPDELNPIAVPYGSPLILNPPAPTSQPNPQGQMPRPDMVPVTKAEQAIKAVQYARECAKRAETQIWDWMVGCQHNREIRKVIFDASRLGVGVLKFAPDQRKSMARINGKIETLYELFPTDSWVDPWNIFPDPACGESIRDGDYIFERAFLSERQVEKLKGLPGYINSQIDKAIELGPGKQRKHAANRKPSERNELKQDYEVWYFHGAIRKSDFETLNPEAAKSVGKAQRVYAIVTMIEDTPVKGAINPLESGDLPYLNVPWQRRPGSWVGIGVAEQIQVPQKIVNAATRALLNNAGISAGPQIIINTSGVTPADKVWELTPNKIWYSENDGVVDDVRKAFYSFDIANVGKAMMDIIQYGMRLAEESTNIPLITQGQSGDTTPETLGATQLQNNNANQLLRDIGYQFDDFITEPLVRMYYEYLLLDEDTAPELKGAFRINAHGSASLVERAIQDQTILQLGPYTLNPQYKADPAKWFANMVRTKRLSPEDFQYTPEQQQAIDSKPPVPAPQVQVAMINAKVAEMKMKMDMARVEGEKQLDLQIANLEAQTELEIARMEQTTNQLRVKLDTDRDTVYVKAELARASAEHQVKMEELSLKKEIAIAEFAAKYRINQEQVKSKLADSAMKLRVQKELAAAEQQIDLHKHHTPTATDVMTLEPPVQLPGKASPGKAFSQV
jgi:hypothetical protein